MSCKERGPSASPRIKDLDRYLRYGCSCESCRATIETYRQQARREANRATDE